MERPLPNVSIVHPWELQRPLDLVARPLPLPIPDMPETIVNLSEDRVNRSALTPVLRIMPYIIRQPKPQNGDRR
jgi:hypothetical protein